MKKLIKIGFLVAVSMVSSWSSFKDLDGNLLGYQNKLNSVRTVQDCFGVTVGYLKNGKTYNVSGIEVLDYEDPGYLLRQSPECLDRFSR